MMRTVLYFLGSILKAFSFFFLVPILYASFTKEPILPFVVPMVIAFLAGIALRGIINFLNLISDQPISLESISLTQGIVLTAVSFICISMLSAIPFLFVFDGGAGERILDSLFEASSGITTTGLSVIDDVDLLPRSQMLWRSQTQWMGGIGIIIVFFFIIYKIRHQKEGKATGGASAATALYTTIHPEQVLPGLRKAAWMIILTYSSLTAIGLILLIIAGMAFFDAVNITFTSISTGGFMVTNSLDYGGTMLIVMSLLMIIGAFSFFIHLDIVNLRFKALYRNPEIRMLALIFIPSFLVGLIFFPDASSLLFTLISAFTTTGYELIAIPLLPQILIFLVTMIMLIGGSMGSTAGGIKLFRAFTILKAIPWMIKRLSNPQNAIIPFKIQDKPMDPTILLVTEIFISGYLIFSVIGTLLFMVLGFSFLDSSFQVISALSTCGLSTLPISGLPWIGKMFLMAAMFLGRLEIFPLLVLIRKLTR